MSKYKFQKNGYNVYRTRSGSSPRRKKSSGSKTNYGIIDALAKGIVNALLGKRRK